jgi:hypothetical protein
VRLIAFPEVNEVFGYGWLEGSQVSLTINGSFVQEVTVGPAPWDANDILAYFSFGDLHDLITGDLVSLSGSGLDEAHTVRSLSVTEVDPVADTVAGTADDGEIVDVYAFEFSDSVVHVTAASGAWSADFTSIPVDLVEGMCGRTDIWDEVGNSTTVDWCVPPAPELEQLWAWAFTYDAPVGTWTAEEHTYYFEQTHTEPTPGGGSSTPVTFMVDGSASTYDGLVLLRAFSVTARSGETCVALDPRVLHPDEQTRFVFGWVTDYPMTYSQAVAQFVSMRVWARWDGGAGVEMTPGMVMPESEIGSYLCGLAVP